jgi:transposase
VEIILGQARRRWSEDEKRALVAETFADGQTVNGVARRHNISRSMLFGWRKRYCGTLGFAAPPTGRKSWLGLFEQFFRFDKWNACRVQAAAICDSRLK